jgi:hypothetical protein
MTVMKVAVLMSNVTALLPVALLTEQKAITSLLNPIMRNSICAGGHHE